MAKRKETNDIWSLSGGKYYLAQPSIEVEKLENAVYSVHQDEFGRFYLKKKQDTFTFDYKLYGLETKLVDRIIKTHEHTTGNVGVLLNGLRGTGKTITSKIICNQLNQPVIVIGAHYGGVHLFINSIPQDITVFIDEYEKIFGDSSDMLTIMDGALNSEYRRVFLLTTNNLYVDENLLQRPSRIRYLKKFEDLTPHIVEEIIDDILVHKHLKKECLQFISTLEIITIDIVKSVLSEVNIHNESPTAFQDIYNVKKIKGKYDVEIQGTDGKFVTFKEDQYVNRRPRYTEENIEDWFQVGNDGDYLGKITKIINYNTIEISPVNGHRDNVLTEPTIFKITDSDIKHYAYAYDHGYGTADHGVGNTKPKTVGGTNVTELLKRLEKRKNQEDNEDEDEDWSIDESPSLSSN